MASRIIRPIFQKIASSLGVPQIQGRLDSLEQVVHDPGLNPAIFDLLERRIIDQAMSHSASSFGKFVLELEERLTSLNISTANHAENRLISLNHTLVEHVDAKQDLLNSALKAHEEFQAKILSGLRESIDVIRRQVGINTSSIVHGQSVQNIPSPQIIDDGLYVAIENHFRGNRNEVAERQRAYLDSLPDTITSETPLVDLGCGRGEWLNVMRELKIPALGVDSNAVCAAECRENGLTIEETDLLTFLQARSDRSVGTYTLFQVLEHLPFPVLLEVLRHIRRTLVPGGLLIAEVPNAKNLRVASGTFWIDPTHQRPLFPELLLFLATEVGFTNADGRYVNDYSPKHDLTGLPQGAEIALQSLLYAVDGPGDFALLATA